jgi:glutamate--cysteine ligase
MLESSREPAHRSGAHVIDPPHSTPDASVVPAATRAAHDHDEPISHADLVDFFSFAERPDPSTHKIGTELEKFGVRVPEGGGAPVPIDYGDIAKVLAGLERDYGWLPSDHGLHGETVALARDGASITLEPGGQFELSGKPLRTVHETCAEFTQHYRELHAVSQPIGVSWFTTGFHPWATRDEINWMPKGRYQVMGRYLPTKGAKALDMMLRTCTVQANFDYTSERQCGERLRLANAFAPFITATFASSPYEEGRASGLRTGRSAVWLEVDPARCGVPSFAFLGSRFGYGAYIDWALDVPMFFVYRDGTYHEHHAPFREFLAHGYTDPSGTHHVALWHDWVNHLSTVFPEVRLKPFVEFRSADAVPSKYVCALPAMLKGLLYDEGVAAEAWELLAGATPDDRERAWTEARALGLSSPFVRDKARRLVELARGSLEHAAVLDDKGRTEARFLDPVDALVDAGAAPADAVLEAMGPAPGRDADARRNYVRSFYFAGVEV